MLLQNNFLQWIFKIFNIIANIVPKCFFLHNLYCKGDITFMINIYACM